MIMAELDETGAAASPRPEAVDTLATRFGPVPLDPGRQIRFRGGLPGFPEAEHFQLDPIPDLASDFMLLQAIGLPDIGFIVVVLPDDVPVIRRQDIEDVRAMLDIGLGELMVLAVVTLVRTGDGIDKVVNLRAPLFVDARRKLGAQVVLANPAYPLRHPLVWSETGN